MLVEYVPAKYYIAMEDVRLTIRNGSGLCLVLIRTSGRLSSSKPFLDPTRPVGTHGADQTPPRLHPWSRGGGGSPSLLWFCGEEGVSRDQTALGRGSGLWHGREQTTGVRCVMLRGRQHAVLHCERQSQTAQLVLRCKPHHRDIYHGQRTRVCIFGSRPSRPSDERMDGASRSAPKSCSGIIIIN